MSAVDLDAITREVDRVRHVHAGIQDHVRPGLVTGYLLSVEQSAADIPGLASTVTALAAEVRRLRTVPAAAEPTDRQLIAAAHRWARTHGWTWHEWNGWINNSHLAKSTIGVDWSNDAVIVRRRVADYGWRSAEYPVESVRQAVDVLAALAVLPIELSTGYRAGQATAVALIDGDRLSTPDDDCTHGGDCRVHPDARMPHNYDREANQQ